MHNTAHANTHTHIYTPQACPSAYYALLLIGGHVIAADRAKSQPPLDPLDIMLLSNFVTSNTAYR